MKQAPASMRFAAIAVDAAVFSIIDETLHVLVDPVNRPPHYVNVDGFLGGIIQAHETAEAALTRMLKEKASLSKLYFEQLYTFSEVNRDKRNRVISVAYFGLVRPDVAENYTHPTARFVPVKGISKLAYDHAAILDAALTRLKGKLSYTTIAQYLLPTHFTLTELQSVYEIVLGHELDKRNFRKKILSLGIIKDTGRMQEGVKNRPAALYAFTSSKLEELPSDFQ